MNPKIRKPKRPTRRKIQNGALMVVIGCFITSAMIRMGVSGPAIAEQMAASQNNVVPETHADTDITDMAELDLMLDTIREREASLNSEDERISARLEILNSVEVEFERKRQELEDAEKKLAATLAQTDDAVLRDIAQLTAVYENMKPKNAAVIFDEMDPNFSAGFLIRMNPQAAADILSSMETNTAYEVSVIMANRNIATISN